MAATAEELSSQAEGIEEIIDFFKIDVSQSPQTNTKQSQRKTVDFSHSESLHQEAAVKPEQSYITEAVEHKASAGADIGLKEQIDSLDEFEKI